MGSVAPLTSISPKAFAAQETFCARHRDDVIAQHEIDDDPSGRLDRVHS